ncbi:hypothetical protein ACJJID_05145 [Microbulbifer sp. CnH-101-G]|uniref:hypothetical protein n=1 Tax=Microbulbifer sp. CnH-101-G TaxID=3243393 RepID=UPI004039B707
MNRVAVQPMQWKSIIDISETEDLTSNDMACFVEVRNILKKYGVLDKFGLSLIHKHFEIAPDECMLEHTDLNTRTLTIKPVKESELVPGDTTITMWRLTDTDKVAEVGCRCARSPDGHWGRHEGF